MSCSAWSVPDRKTLAFSLVKASAVGDSFSLNRFNIYSSSR
ncbi:hypothetical protein SAMD00079811_71020 [Scytonema sp. HK-05]|nr:hypothetical protein SAMD00079811_71020 [Scytonema sp. HK-05]